MLPTLKGKHNPGDRPTKGNRSLGSALIKSRNKAKIKFQKDFEKFRAERKEVNAKAKLESATEMTNLNEFLYKAELENRQFEGQKVSRLLIEEGEKLRIVNTRDFERARLVDKELDRAQVELNSGLMKIPRKPDWWGKTVEDQRASENKSFLDWRAKLAELNDRFRGSLSPYEKNLEVWRQLWHVVDRSDLLVQVLDARDPAFFRCFDLEVYVNEKGREETLRKQSMVTGDVQPGVSTKKNFLILNKADLVPEKARKVWSEFFRKKGIDHVFFSAKIEQEEICELEEEASKKEKEIKILRNQIEQEVNIEMSRRKLNQKMGSWEDQKVLVKLEVEDRMKKQLETLETATETKTEGGQPVESFLNSPRIINRRDLVSLFCVLKKQLMEKWEAVDKNLTPKEGVSEKKWKFAKEKLTIGMVGFPNVGKSSLINSLCEKKKVGVDSKPGKTKNFQTIVLDATVTLCDCPGLVFPSLAASQAEMVCKGVLPLNNISGFVDPVRHLLEHCDYVQLSNLYFLPNSTNQATLWRPSAQEVLQFFAASRGYTAGSGIPDENKASKIILKDLIDGRISHFKLPGGDLGVDTGGLTRAEYLEQCFLEMSPKRDLITLAQVEKTFKNIDTNDLDVFNKKKREMAGEEDIHSESKALEFEEVMDMIGPDQIEQLMEGKKVGPFKLNKAQRRELKFGIQGGMGFDELEKMFRGFVQKTDKQSEAFGVKGRKGKRKGKGRKRRG